MAPRQGNQRLRRTGRFLECRLELLDTGVEFPLSLQHDPFEVVSQAVLRARAQNAFGRFVQCVYVLLTELDTGHGALRCRVLRCLGEQSLQYHQGAIHVTVLGAQIRQLQVSRRV